MIQAITRLCYFSSSTLTRVLNIASEKNYLLGLLHSIWETLISHIRLVLAVLKVKAIVTWSVAVFPMST